MKDILDYLRDFNIVSMMLRLLLAFLCGGMIGMERGKRGRAAGFRTHILVCLGAAMTVMTGLFAVQTLDINSDPLRIGAQVISGIGFLGAGTILITGNTHVKGLRRRLVFGQLRQSVSQSASDIMRRRFFARLSVC
jgi:putative Mg2+ transporter-C (MgtC) family protein